MGKKTISRDRRRTSYSTINRSNRNVGEYSDKLSKKKEDKQMKSDNCSICLNQIKVGDLQIKFCDFV